MSIKIITLLLPVIFFLLILELVRRHRLTFKYAIGWICLSLVTIFFIVFDKLLFALAYWFGFELPSNFVFFTLLAFFVFLSLLLTTFICQQDKHNSTMAQRIGLLELKIEKLGDEKK